MRVFRGNAKKAPRRDTAQAVKKVLTSWWAGKQAPCRMPSHQFLHWKWDFSPQNRPAPPIRAAGAIENSTVCAVQRFRRSMRENVRRWFERAAAAIWTAFVRWGRTGHAGFSWECKKSAAQRYRSGCQKSLNKLVGREASSLPYALSSVFTLEMGFFAAKIVPLCPYALLVRLKIRQSARRRDSAVQREELYGGDLDGFREMGANRA